MLEAYDNREEKVSLGILSRQYLKTFLDPSFQRYGGVENGSGWSKTQCEEYIGNLVSDMTCNSVIRADVDSCLRFALEENDKESESYFKDKKDKGFESVSIDGNNSTSSIYHFIEKGMCFNDPQTDEKKLLKDHDEQEQMDIRWSNKITVHTLKRISYQGMCHLFRNVNKSTKLNAQEYRQAMPTKLAAFVREVSNK
jgi:hypothetical protein